MQRNLTHDRTYETACDFKTKAMTFRTEHVPQDRHLIRDPVTDDFRAIDAARISAAIIYSVLT